MNPKQFLVIGGVVLVLVAILGWVNVIGPTPDDSVFGPSWYFTNGENWAHLVLGVIALLASVALTSEAAQKWLVVLVGLAGIAFGIWNFFLPDTAPNFYGVANLEKHADTALHFVVGIWALLAAFVGKKSAA